MSCQPLVLLVPADRVTGAATIKGLVSYGYEVLSAGSMEQAREMLRAHRRICVLVVDTDPRQAEDGLSLARDARAFNPDLKIIYTSHLPSRISHGQKVIGAPCLRTPYRPHQLVSVIGQLIRRPVAEEMVASAA